MPDTTKQTSNQPIAKEYEAIVIGSGIRSGGWACKELTQNGLKTLCLERAVLLSMLRTTRLP